MNLLTRFSATLMAGVDKTVSQIENHDAVVEASLKDSQRAAAQARVRLQRVTRDGDEMLRRQKMLEQKIQHWTDRAKSNHILDRPLALQCIAKRKQCVIDEQEVKVSLQHHAELEKQVINTLSTIEKRVAAMSQQRNQMRSRQSAVEAQRIINKVQNCDTNGIDDTFERWDITISETEINAGVAWSDTDTDVLDKQFNALEEKQALEAELDTLVDADTTTENESAADQSVGRNDGEQ